MNTFICVIYAIYGAENSIVIPEKIAVYFKLLARAQVINTDVVNIRGLNFGPAPVSDVRALTHCGQVTPSCLLGLGQHWPR